MSIHNNRFVRGLGRNSPHILTGLGVAGAIMSVIMAVKATPKALEVIHQETEFRRDPRSVSENDPEHLEPDEELAPLDVVEVTWRIYAPTAAMLILTSICIVGANSILTKRNSALAGLVALAEGALYDYQKEVVKQIGPKKERLIQDKLGQKDLDDHPFTKETKVHLTGQGDYLCRDQLSGRYFYSNIESIRRAEVAFNKQLVNDWAISLNEFYHDLGLDPIDMGVAVGWTMEHGLMDVDAISGLAGEELIPCLVLIHRNKPVNLW